jgi:hypothetical protein
MSLDMAFDNKIPRFDMVFDMPLGMYSLLYDSLHAFDTYSDMSFNMTSDMILARILTCLLTVIQALNWNAFWHQKLSEKKSQWCCQ